MNDYERLVTAENAIELLQAHVENLIERMAAMEEGHEFEFTAKCRTCSWVMTGTAPMSRSSTRRATATGSSSSTERPARPRRPTSRTSSTRSSTSEPGSKT